jgi:hypothetical protein
MTKLNIPPTTQMSRHTAFGEDEAESQKLSMDPGGSPIRDLFCQSSDQRPSIFGDLRPSAAGPGSPSPVEPKAGAVPANHGLGPHDNENVGPAGPETAESRTEDSVQRVQVWPGSLAFQNGDLLSEGKDFERRVASTAEEHADCFVCSASTETMAEKSECSSPNTSA